MLCTAVQKPPRHLRLPLNADAKHQDFKPTRKLVLKPLRFNVKIAFFAQHVIIITMDIKHWFKKNARNTDRNC